MGGFCFGLSSGWVVDLVSKVRGEMGFFSSGVGVDMSLRIFL